ncbi:hypothetical protein D3C83_232080 [compost metagenome]
MLGEDLEVGDRSLQEGGETGERGSAQAAGRDIGVIFHALQPDARAQLMNAAHNLNVVS